MSSIYIECPNILLKHTWACVCYCMYKPLPLLRHLWHVWIWGLSLSFELSRPSSFQYPPNPSSSLSKHDLYNWEIWFSLACFKSLSGFPLPGGKFSKLNGVSVFWGTNVPGKDIWNLRKNKMIDPFVGFAMPIKKLRDARWEGGSTWSRYM